MRLIPFVALAVSLAGQVTPTLAVPSTPINPGQVAAITVSIASVSPMPTAVQWVTTWNSAMWTAVNAVIAPTLSGKTLACQSLGQSGGLVSYLCEIDGPNTIGIPNGPIATINLTAGSTLGLTPLSLTGAIASDGTGSGIAAITPSPSSITIAAPLTACDLNKDGKTDQSDVTIARTQLLGQASGLSADLDKDGKVSVIDLQRMQNAAGGAVCKLG